VILGAVIVGALAVIFRLSPNRDQPRMKWVSSGAIMAAVFWLLASIGFSFYANNFGSYNETYGSIAAVIILMFWLYITAFIILIGAELNGQLELQTRKDTTTGPEKPMGERDAFAADEVADAPETKKKR
jgi:membrane protein